MAGGRQEGQAGPGHHVGVEDVPPEGGPFAPGVLEGGEPRIDLAAIVLTGPAATRLTAPGRVPGPGRVTGERLERRLGHAHPVVDRPGHSGVEVESTTEAPGRPSCRRPPAGAERLDEALSEYVDTWRAIWTCSQSPEDVTAQALGRGVADGVEQPVEAVPPVAQLRGAVASWPVRSRRSPAPRTRRQLARGPPGQRQPAARTAQHHLGALLLGRTAPRRRPGRRPSGHR